MNQVNVGYALDGLESLAVLLQRQEQLQTSFVDLIVSARNRGLGTTSIELHSSDRASARDALRVSPNTASRGEAQVWARDHGAVP